MSTKNFSLVGIAESVQFGKDGGRLVQSSGNFALRNAGDTTNTNLTAEDVTLTGELLASAGSAAAPSISFSGDADTGLFGASNVLGFATNGAERLALRDPSTTDAVATFAGTSAVTLPSGEDGTRPSTPVAGMIRYNTTSGAFEYRNASAWVTVVGASNEFADNVFRIVDNDDATKKLAFEVSGVTTATTRTVTMVDRSFTLDTVTTASTDTNATTGSILFADGGKIDQDNANLFWNNTDNRLGVGTTTPDNRLDVVGDVGVRNAGKVRFYEAVANGTDYVSFAAPADLENTTTSYTLPAADGTSGQALVTNGSAVLSWATVTTPGALRTLTAAITETSSGSNNLGTALPAGAVVVRVRIQITTAWTGTFTVGSTSAATELMLAADIDEKFVGFSEKNVSVDPTDDQLTYSNSTTGTGVGVAFVEYTV
jgi:hypothetical protein